MVFDRMTEKTRKMADSYEQDKVQLQQELEQARKQGANDKAQLNIVTAQIERHKETIIKVDQIEK